MLGRCSTASFNGTERHTSRIAAMASSADNAGSTESVFPCDTDMLRLRMPSSTHQASQSYATAPSSPSLVPAPHLQRRQHPLPLLCPQPLLLLLQVKVNHSGCELDLTCSFCQTAIEQPYNLKSRRTILCMCSKAATLLNKWQGYQVDFEAPLEAGEAEGDSVR